jgi:hypothetical protein
MSTRLKHNSAVIISNNLRRARAGRSGLNGHEKERVRGNSSNDLQPQTVESWLNSQLGLEGSCKPIVEAHLAEKCHDRSLAEKKFKWDIFLLVTYTLFLVFYSAGACSSNAVGKFQVRSVLEPQIGSFQFVQSIGEILILQDPTHSFGWC